LVASGLLGPVTIRQAVVIAVKPLKSQPAVTVLINTKNIQGRPREDMLKIIDFIDDFETAGRMYRQTPSHSIGSCLKVLIFDGAHPFSEG
jgi:hypothetical protein